MELAIKVLQKDINVVESLILDNVNPKYNADWREDRLQLVAAIEKLKEVKDEI